MVFERAVFESAVYNHTCGPNNFPFANSSKAAVNSNARVDCDAMRPKLGTTQKTLRPAAR
jgi:hypothetical protein